MFQKIKQAIKGQKIEDSPERIAARTILMEHSTECNDCTEICVACVCPCASYTCSQMRLQEYRRQREDCFGPCLVYCVLGCMLGPCGCAIIAGESRDQMIHVLGGRRGDCCLSWCFHTCCWPIALGNEAYATKVLIKRVPIPPSLAPPKQTMSDNGTQQVAMTQPAQQNFEQVGPPQQASPQYAQQYPPQQYPPQQYPPQQYPPQQYPPQQYPPQQYPPQQYPPQQYPPQQYPPQQQYPQQPYSPQQQYPPQQFPPQYSPQQQYPPQQYPPQQFPPQQQPQDTASTGS